MPELEKLGIDWLLGLDSFEHMGGVTVWRRGVTLPSPVKWGKDNPKACCGGTGLCRTEARVGVRGAVAAWGLSVSRATTTLKGIE